MSRVEKHFRIQHLAERIRQLQGEVIALEDEIATTGGLVLAGIHLSKAAEALERTPILDLETQLRLSIESVEEKKRCRDMGGALPFEKFL